MLDLEYSRGAFSQSILVILLIVSAWHMVRGFSIGILRPGLMFFSCRTLISWESRSSVVS